MKNKILQGWRWIFAVSSTVVFLGCLDETSKSNAESSAAIAAPKASVADEIAPSNVVDNPPLRAVIAPADLSPGISEVVKLAQSGVGEEVLQAYVEKSGRTFNPTVDEIVYLKDLGLPESVLAALVRQGNLPHDIVQQTISSTQHVENSSIIQEPKTSSNTPTLIDPAAPSYSVVAENPPAQAAPAAQQVNINYFEETLSPYGSWVDVPDYGRCWQPTVVVINRSWRPYSDRGRWVYTSAGWYWQSDYSWGWAPFHYGRWHQDNRIGWVWVPGSTWGPAWVSWRYTDSYCGWAPLPPSAHYVSGFGFSYRSSRVGISFDFGLRDDCYTFIPTSRFCDPTPYRHYVPRSQSTTIYNNSVVINNYIRGNNNTIINEGIGRDRISTATRTPIRTVALRDLPTTTTPVGRAERMERDGNSLSVFRPNLTAQNSLVRSREQQNSSTALTATSPTERRSFTASRTPAASTEASRSTPNTSATAQTPIARDSATASAARPTFTRTWTQPSTTPRTTVATREQSLAPTVGTSSPTTENRPLTSTRTQPSFGSRSVPSQTISRGQEPARMNATPQENTASAPRAIPSTIQTQNQPAPTRISPSISSRPEPRISQPPQVERRELHTQSGGFERSFRAAQSTPVPVYSAPAPVQRPTYSAPQVSGNVGRVERSIPQQSQPAPSVAPQRSAPPQASESSSGNRGGLSRSSRERN